MEFRILGPLEVRDRGRPVELHRQKQRALLAILLLRARQVVSSDALVDALWGEDAPPTALAALRNYVSQLRAALGPSVLWSQAGGYLLDVQPDQLDLSRFERLTAEGRRASGEERAEKLREALALWRGPPLAELEFEPFAIDECRRLEELRIAALEDRIDAELALGSGAELVSELQALVAKNPFRERLRGQLMLALYRGGRQAEALEAYQETRRRLVDELGIEPSDALRELEQAILRHDPALASPGLVGEAELPPARRERRTTATVLFADVAYPENLDPELLRTTTLRMLPAIRGVLEEHGATIEQRSGDELMAVFGVPRAHEDDAVRAARAALEVQRAVAAQADVVERSGWGRIQSRAGIDTGEVLAGADETGHGFIVGPTVGVAKRLLQAAAPGEILAGPATAALLGHAIVSRPARGAPREAIAVLEAVEGAAATKRHLETPLVGRDAELAMLHAAYDRVAAEGRSRLVLVLGEAGIGKTRLAAELTQQLEGRATILTARCLSYGRAATYQPLRDLVDAVLRVHDVDDLLAGDEHARLITAGVTALVEEAAPVSRSDMFWSLRRLFEALAAQQPLVLVFEDLHWAEPIHLDLVDYLAGRAERSPILVLGLARPELLDERDGWQRADMVALGPLSTEAGDALLANLADVPEGVRDRIVRTAGGSPLFLEQLLAHTSEGGEPEEAPGSLAALLASRLDRLEDEEHSLLQRAAVVGSEFERSTLVQLAGAESAAGTGEHLRALVRKGFVSAGRNERFRFDHVLIRDAAYATLPKLLRAELHERLARLLERDPAASDELIGFHLEQAHAYLVGLGAAGDRRTERVAEEAGRRLRAAGLAMWRRADTSSAIDLLERASGLLPTADPARLELLCEHGLALRTAGEIDRANRVLEEAAESAAAAGERRIELRARMELANAHLSTHPEGGGDALLRVAEEAIPTFEAFGDDRSLGRAWLLAGYVRGGLHCRNAEWREAAERALDHYRRSGWPPGSCAGEIATSLYYGPTPVAEGIDRCRRLLEESDERTGQAHVLVWLGGLEGFAGRGDVARRLVRRAEAVYDELGHGMPLLCGCYPVLAEIERLGGRLEEAEALLRASCDGLEAMHERACLASRAAELADVMYGRRRYEEAERWFRVAEEHAATDDLAAQLLARAVRGKILARRGSSTAAETCAREAVQIAEQTDALNSRARVLLDLAEIVRLDERPDEARALAARACELLEQKGNVVGAEHARALAADA